MPQSLSLVGLILGIVAAIEPLLITAMPRLRPAPLYRLQWTRTALALVGLAAAMAGYWHRPNHTRLLALPVVLSLAAFSQIFQARYFFVALDRPRHLRAPAGNLADEALVLGIERAGEAFAWPLELVAPHHLVNDVVGGAPVLVSY